MVERLEGATWRGTVLDGYTDERGCSPRCTRRRGLLQKPFTIEALANKVRQTLDAAGNRRSGASMRAAPVRTELRKGTIAADPSEA